jgi:hypothetical protein
MGYIFVAFSEYLKLTFFLEYLVVSLYTNKIILKYIRIDQMIIMNVRYGLHSQIYLHE